MESHGLQLAITVIFLLVTVTVGKMDPDFGSECPCAEEKGLVCGFDGLCTCRAGEIFSKYCQRSRYGRLDCWNQCLGVPNNDCVKNFSPFNVDRKQLICVPGAECVSKDGTRSNLICQCQPGFRKNVRGTRCESEESDRNVNDKDEWTEAGHLKPHPSIEDDSYFSQANKSEIERIIVLVFLIINIFSM